MTSQDLLDRLLASHPSDWPGAGELLTFIAGADEDTWLEYKSEHLFRPDDTEDPDLDPPEKVRKEVGAFANTDGGVLIVGVHDKNKEVTGVDRREKSGLENWAVQALRGLMPFFHPPPRIATVDLDPSNPDSRQLLLVVTPRAPQLVSCPERGRRPVYYLRVGEHSLPAADATIADLHLGRREQPNLSLTAERLGCEIERVDYVPIIPRPGESHDKAKASHELLGLRFSFRLEHDGPWQRRELRAGLVGWSSTLHESRDRHGEIIEYSMADHAWLRRYLDVLEPQHWVAEGVLFAFELRHFDLAPTQGRAAWPVPGAFGRVVLANTGRLLLPAAAPQKRRWEGAVYVAPEGGILQWWSVSFEETEEFRSASDWNRASNLPLHRCAGRPRIAWEPFWARDRA